MQIIHLGDITKINGHDVPIVDCVIGGSPCQDLSIAGKRAGLAGERSGLYVEAKCSQYGSQRKKKPLRAMVADTKQEERELRYRI